MNARPQGCGSQGGGCNSFSLKLLCQSVQPAVNFCPLSACCTGHVWAPCTCRSKETALKQAKSINKNLSTCATCQVPGQSTLRILRDFFTRWMLRARSCPDDGMLRVLWANMPRSTSLRL